MPLEQTLAIIKPDAFMRGHVGEIIACIEEQGFRLKMIKTEKLSEKQACSFYQVHQQKPFFRELCGNISSGLVVVMVLEKENAIADFRTLMGTTDPLQAKPDTIRKKYGISISENSIHGSDSSENAAQEIAFFFPKQSLSATG